MRPSPITTIWCKVTASRPALLAASAAAVFLFAPAPAPATAGEPAAGAPAAGRIVRVSPAQVREIEHLRLTAQELLDENFRLFDPAALSISPPRRLIDEIGRPRLYLEIANTSKQDIALAPQAAIRVYVGARELRLHSAWKLPDRLYPGERVPLELSGEAFGDFTEFKADWRPARREALPGSRPRLEVVLDRTEARIGTGTLNFTQRFRYKYVIVQGRIRNDDTRPVDRATLWATLYDDRGQLTGAVAKEIRLPGLKPGDSAPFELNVNQYGANFTRVAIVCDAPAP